MICLFYSCPFDINFLYLSVYYLLFLLHFNSLAFFFGLLNPLYSVVANIWFTYKHYEQYLNCSSVSAGDKRVSWGEKCQISLVVIKIDTKYPSRLLNLCGRWLASAWSHDHVQSVAVPCLEPALSGACLPTASAAALSGFYFTHWQLKEGPPFFSFSRIIRHHGRQKEPYQVMRPLSVGLGSGLCFLGSRFGCVSLTQRSFLPFFSWVCHC